MPCLSVSLGFVRPRLRMIYGKQSSAVFRAGGLV